METDQILVRQYNDEDKEEWNEFVKRSKNATFLHEIDYLHYHIDRFTDCSLIIEKKGKILAVLPGNIEGNVYYSHKGLTYAGLLILNETKVEDVINYFKVINEYLKIEKKIDKVVYKCIPYIYSDIPSQEDEYALFRMNAVKVSCGVSSTIDMKEKIIFGSSRTKSIKKSQKYSCEIRVDFSYEDFWDILSNNLKSKHNAMPVHNCEEIKRLKTKFPDNIKLYAIYVEGQCIAGVVIYITHKVAHLQYISANEYGKEISALDFLFNYLIKDEFKEIDFFDFGSSVEKNGRFLNEGLSFQKQGFGARAVVYNQYEYYLD